MKNTQLLKLKNKKKIIKVYGKKYLNPIKFNIPGDPSSCCFFYSINFIK